MKHRNSVQRIIATMAIASFVFGCAAQSKAEDEVTQVMNLYLDAWEQKRFDEMYSHLITKLSQTEFVEGLQQSELELRSFKLKSIELLEDDRAKASFTVEIPEIEYIAGKLVFTDSELGYPSNCQEANEQTKVFTVQDDFVNLVKQDDEWKIGFQGDVDYLQTGNGTLYFAFELPLLGFAASLFEPNGERETNLIFALLGVYSKDFHVEGSALESTTKDIVEHLLFIRSLCQ